MRAKARRVEWAAAAAVLALLGACEKASDREGLAVLPKFDLTYCYGVPVSAPIQFQVDGCMTSPNRAYVLRMTLDGALEVDSVAAGGRPGAPIWTSHSHSKARTASGTFQQDGNLVIYGPGGPTWSSASYGALADYKLSLSDDGALAITTAADGKMIWTSQAGARPCSPSWAADVTLHAGGCVASPNASFVLTLSPAGSLDLTHVGSDGVAGPAIWSSGSHGAASGSAIGVMQSDGNLVVYDQNKPIWNSITPGAPGRYQLDVTDQGEAVIHAPDGRKIWSSKTGKT